MNSIITKRRIAIAVVALLAVGFVFLTTFYSTSTGPITTQKHAAETGSFTCSWTTSIANDYTFQVRLVDSDGQMIAQNTVAQKVTTADQVLSYTFTGIDPNKTIAASCEVELANKLCPIVRSEVFYCPNIPSATPSSGTPTPSNGTPTPSNSTPTPSRGTPTPSSGTPTATPGVCPVVGGLNVRLTCPTCSN